MVYANARLQVFSILQLFSQITEAGIKPHFLSQKMAHKDHEKKMTSIAVNAIMHLAKLAVVVAGGTPALESPQCFQLDAWYSFDGLQKVHLFGGIFGICINSERVCLTVDFLDGYLEAVKGLDFGRMDVGTRLLLSIPAVACWNWDEGGGQPVDSSIFCRRLHRSKLTVT